MRKWSTIIELDILLIEVRCFNVCKETLKYRRNSSTKSSELKLKLNGNIRELLVQGLEFR